MARRSALVLTACIASGLLIGSALRFWNGGSIPTNTAAQRESSLTPSLTEPTPDRVAPDLPRPTLEEVTNATASELPTLLHRYLEGASMDEIFLLSEGAAEWAIPVEDYFWMIQMRGLELDPQALLVWTRRQKGHPNYLISLYRCWSGIDPRSALTASLSEGSSQRKQVIQAIASNDIEEALALVRELIPNAPELKDLELQQRIASVKGDFRTALSEALTLPHATDRKQHTDALIEAWAEADPLAALEWVEGQSELSNDLLLRQGIIEQLANTHPELAHQKLQSLPLSKSRITLEGKVVERWVNRDPESALAWIKELPGSSRRNFLFSAIADHLPKDAEDLFAFVAENEIGVDISVVDQMYRNNPLWQRLRQGATELAKESPQKALEALYSINMLDVDHWDIVRKWAEKEPEVAMRWAEKLPDKDFAHQIQAPAIQEWAKTSPEDAAAYLTKSGLSSDRSLALWMGLAWAFKDAEAGLEWIGQLEEDVRAHVYDFTLNQLAEAQPQNALREFNEIEDTQLQSMVLDKATKAWGKQDPQGLMSWLTEQPSEAQIDSIIEAESCNWVLSDPQKASAWISSLPQGIRRDHAVAGMVRALVVNVNPQKDLEAAEQWIQTISDPTLQQRARDQLNGKF